MNFDRLGWAALKLLIRAQFPKVRSISTDTLASWLTQVDSKPILLDVRTAPEYAVSHLANARQIDPNTQDFLSLKDVPLTAPIVTYCSVGYRSSAIADRLQQAGFTNVVNLEGSIFQWANEGKPVYRQGKPVRKVHPYSPKWGYLLERDYHDYGQT